MWLGRFVILFSLSNALTKENPTVRTKFGAYEGIWTKSMRGHLVANYLGIPYAKAPIGELRFKKPERWTKRLEATSYATRYRQPCSAVQSLEDGNEDCLYLNVFTKQNSKRAKNSTRPAVMVFLISDSFGKTNNSFYTPEYLLEYDVVLVTVNYRLGYFGFFATGDEVAPGNYGLKDVLEALYWIQNNIAAFGGDPGSVTLMGQGAGAGVVHLLALSQKSEGLFHRYVTHSGSAQMTWSYRPRETAKKTSLKFAASVGCDGETNQEIVNCLQNLDVSISGDNSTEIVTPWSSYGPTDEPESDEAVITQDPKILIREGKARDIPWIVGLVADEGSIIDFTKFYRENSTICEELKIHFEKIVYAIADYQGSVKDSFEFINSLISFYFDDEITEDCESHLIELAGDITINWPIFDAMTRQASSMNSPVYFYNFAYNGTFTALGCNEDDKSGVSHGDDVNYLFPVLNNFCNILEESQMENTELDRGMINILTEMWTNFATMGIPNASSIPDWRSYREEGNYMKFNPQVNLSIEQNFLEERMTFWLNLTEDLFIDYEAAEGSNDESEDTGSASSIRQSYCTSLSIVSFLAQFVILAVINN